MPEESTREPQYNNCREIRDRIGFARLGLMANQVWYDDQRRMAFLMARYKFVAKMLSGRGKIAEVGCADAFCTRIVLQEVDHVTVFDFDPIFIDDVRAQMNARWPLEAIVHDILEGPLPGRFDGIYSLDVLEHIHQKREDLYLTNLKRSLTEHGVVIVGSPSLESQAYASSVSKAGHVNCKSGQDMKAMLQRHFHTVFLFSMNDEVVHTGFYAMAHYLFALCCEAKRDRA